MDWKDKLLHYSLLVAVASLTGLSFPNFVRYIFVLGAIVGVGGTGYWVYKNLKK